MASILWCLQDLARAASLPEESVVHLVQSKCSYYHYLCDGVDDRGWGCGYRTLQSLCSWAVHCRQAADQGTCTPAEATPPSKPSPRLDVPSVHEIQSCLVAMGDKPHTFIGSKEWIGCVEACIVLDHLYKVPCKILHVPSGHEMVTQLNVLMEHFREVGSPVMIGGDIDGASKTLIGVSRHRDNPLSAKFLIADPHFEGGVDASAVSGGYVRWYSWELFQERSFYNLCLPQIVI